MDRNQPEVNATATAFSVGRGIKVQTPTPENTSARNSASWSAAGVLTRRQRRRRSVPLRAGTRFSALVIISTLFTVHAYSRFCLCFLPPRSKLGAGTTVRTHCRLIRNNEIEGEMFWFTFCYRSDLIKALLFWNLSIRTSLWPQSCQVHLQLSYKKCKSKQIVSYS